jgi:pimeloyl-ACP methyl ester carboxylesterase
MIEQKQTIPFDRFGDSGELIHFAHANGYPPGTYRQFLESLGKDYRVLAIQHRPIWATAPPETMTDWRMVTDDLIALLDSQNAQNIVGIGHSLGGVATMYAALQRPDLFRALILIEPVFLPEQALSMIRENPSLNPFDLPLVKTAMRRRDQWPDRQAAFDHFRPKAVFRRFSDETLWDYVNYGLKADAAGVSLVYSREWEARFYSLPPTDVWSCVPRIAQPTLAIRGSETDTIFPQAWQMWQDLQPQAQFVEMQNVGHMLTMEQPKAVAQIVRDFIGGLPSAS